MGKKELPATYEEYTKLVTPCKMCGHIPELETTIKSGRYGVVCKTCKNIRWWVHFMYGYDIEIRGHTPKTNYFKDPYTAIEKWNQLYGDKEATERDMDEWAKEIRDKYYDKTLPDPYWS